MTFEPSLQVKKFIRTHVKVIGSKVKWDLKYGAYMTSRDPTSVGSLSCLYTLVKAYGVG